MSEQPLDPQGEAHEALNSAVTSYGPRVLSDPRMIGNLVTDLIPDLPREQSLLVTAAGAGVAGELAQHVEEQRLNADTAVQLVARALADRRLIDPAASMWVATEYAQALGYPVRPASRTVTPPPVTPPPTRTLTTNGGNEPPTTPPYVPPTPPYVPPTPPPTWETPPPKRRNRGPILAASGTALVVVLYLVIAAAGHIAPFGPPKPVPTTSRTPHPTPHPTTPTPVPSSVTLAELLPQDLDDPTTQCTPYKPPFTAPGLIQALSCTDPGLPNGSIFAYQVKNSADYQQAWKNYNKWWGFSGATPGASCPVTGSDRRAEGTTPWHAPYFPQRLGQVLECEWVGSGSTLNIPAYAWTYPGDNTWFVAEGGTNSTFAALDTWWGNNGAPAASPTPVAASSS